MLCDLFSWNTASSKVLNSFIRWRLWQSFTHCVPCVPLALPFAAPVNNYTMTVFHAHCFGGCRMPYRPCTLEWPAWKCKPHPYPLRKSCPRPLPCSVFSPSHHFVPHSHPIPRTFCTVIPDPRASTTVLGWQPVRSKFTKFVFSSYCFLWSQKSKSYTRPRLNNLLFSSACKVAVFVL